MFTFCCSSEQYFIHIHVKRYKIDTIPTKISGQKIWIYERFAEKDKLLEDFYVNGSFPNPFKQNPLKKRLLPNLIPFLCFAGFSSIVLFSRRVRIIYIGTLACSPFLIAWLHIKKFI